MEERTILTVITFGKFEIHSETACLNSDTLHSDMLTKLLLYILFHRKQPISVDVLEDALWDDGETDNPAGALKNLMYRLRTILNKTFGKAEYILTSRGVYRWNQDYEVSLDAEKFEALCEQAKTETDSAKRIACLEDAVRLYRGEFMTRITDRHWVMALSTYYHSVLISSVKTLANLYMDRKQYEDVEQLCLYSLRMDPVDEWLYCTLILSLMRQNKNKLAIQYYHEAEKVLYDAFGIKNSKNLQTVHEQLMQTNQGSETGKIQSIHADMTEEQKPEGAYICGYPVFREIYRLESRRISRLGESEYIILMTLQLKEQNIPESQKKMKDYLINRAMDQMETSIMDTLRVGDVASRYSDSQFIMLLPTCTYERCQIVTKRILDHYYQTNKTERGKKILITTDYEEVSDTTSLIDRQV